MSLSRVLFSLLLTVALPSAVSAVPLALHVAPATGSLSCENAPAEIGCGWRQSNLIVQAPLGADMDVYVIAVAIDTLKGLSEVQFSLDFDGEPNKGVDILSWRFCGVEGTPTGGLMPPGTEIAISFQPGCRGTTPDPSGDPYGTVVLAVFRVRAHSPDALLVAGSASGMIRSTNCQGTVVEQGINMYSAGGVGFGGAWSNDPCLFDYYSHGCVAFPTGNCACCMSDSTCRSVGAFFDYRNCIDAAGAPTYSGCISCAVPIQTNTWGAIKARQH